MLELFIYIAISALPVFVDKSRQIFGLIRLYSLLQVALMAPGALVALTDPTVIDPRVAAFFSGTSQATVGEVLLHLSWMNLVVYCVYYGVVALRRAMVVAARFDDFDLDRSIGVARSIFPVMLAVAILLFLAKVILLGGWAHIVSNIGNRVGMQRGFGPLNMLVEASFLLAIVFSVLGYIKGARRARWGPTLVALTCAIVAGSLFGGRKFGLQVLLVTAAVATQASVSFARFRFVTIARMGSVYALGLIYFVAMLAYRAPDPGTAISDRLQIAVDDASEQFFNAAYSMSYLDTYLVCYAAYGEGSYLHWKTFSDLSTAFLPSAFYPDKPPVDDGFYPSLRAKGVHVEPGTPAYRFRGLAAWPPETFGIGYINGGLTGVFICAVLLGVTLGLLQLLWWRWPASPFLAVFVPVAFLNFEISNLRIVSLIMSGVGLAVFCVPIWLLQQRIKLAPRLGRGEFSGNR